MSKKISKLMTEVEVILSESVEARNYDFVLIRLLFKKFYANRLAVLLGADNYYLPLNDGEAISMISKIERCRRKVQERNYLPTIWSVAKRRRIGEQVWRAYMSLHE